MIAFIKRRKAKAAKKHHAHGHPAGHHHQKPAHHKGKKAKSKGSAAKRVPAPRARTVAA